MNLLQLNERDELRLVRHHTDNVPPYAILSHTWGLDADELTFQDVMNNQGQNKAGFIKARFCGEQAKKDGLLYFWVDTCCINKDSSSELSEAIVSMFRWYKRSSRCYVYLKDVTTRKRDSSGQTDGTWETAFLKSKWFTRGWTLQELLAPKSVDFFSTDQILLGNKVTLKTFIHTATGIPVSAIQGDNLSDFSVEERMRWAVVRETRKEEDKAYCLMGIFNVFIPPLYGEREHAFVRLREALEKRGSKHESMSITARASDLQDLRHGSTSPVQQAALDSRREELKNSLAFEQMNTRHLTIKDAQRMTCRWLLQHAAYLAWDGPGTSAEEHNVLWINGKPGAGKSTLMKFAYQHTKKRRKKSRGDILIAFFFNARGGEFEKTTAGMYRSLLFQLFSQAPDVRSILDEIDTGMLGSGVSFPWPLELLQSLFVAAVAELGKRRLICFIDALDECNEQQIRDMVTMFEDLRDSAHEGETELRVCFASRHYPEIRIKKGVSLILENEAGHSEDLKKFIRTTLAAGDNESDHHIRERIHEKSNGVFMWAVLVIHILNREYLAGRMWAVKDKLEKIPNKLSELFQTILRRDHDNMDDLLLCLQWILFSKRPLKAEEFYFAMAAKLDRSGPGTWNREEVTIERIARFVVGSSKGLAELAKSKTPSVQFIHESVRDFLIKDGGLCELWPHLKESLTSSSHDQLKQCCQNYLAVNISEYAPPNQALPEDSSPAAKLLRDAVTNEFPFLAYASQHVFYHAEKAAESTPQQEFLDSFALGAWLHIFNTLQAYQSHRYAPDSTLLYVFSDNDFPQLIRATRICDHWNHIPDARYGYPCLVAFARGNRDALAALMDRDGHAYSVRGITRDPGFGKHCKPGSTRDPLFWAAKNKNWALAEYITTSHRGNDRSSLASKDGRHRIQDVLRLAAEHGPATILKPLLDLGGEVNPRWDHECLLCAAAKNNRDLMVRELLDRGAAVDTGHKSPFYGTALQAASFSGHEQVVRTLLNAGANVNAQGGYYGNALQAASFSGHEQVVQMLLDTGASINAQGGRYGNALQAASARDRKQVAQMLLHAGADLNV